MKTELAEVIISDELKKGIEQHLSSSNSRTLWMGFDKTLEYLFIRYSLARYRKSNLTYPVVGAFGLLLFVFADYQIARGAIYELFLVRCVGFLAVSLTILVISRQKLEDASFSHFRWHQLAICLCGLLIHIILLRVGVIAAKFGDFHYQTGSMLIIMLLGTILRVDFRYLVPTILTILVSQIYFSKFVFNLPDVAVLEHVVMFSMVALFACIANAVMEHEIRKTFLQSLLIQAEKRDLEQAKEQLKQLSLSDPLTGLYNRRGFDERMRSRWSLVIREKQRMSVLMIDIDYFKQYNDNYGHPAGDLAIIEIAKTLMSHSKRPGDLVARVGGEEFIVVLPQTDHSHSLLIAEAIRESVLALNITHNASPYHSAMTVSIGVATASPVHGDNYAALVKEADEQLYLAKSEGRNCVK